MKLLFLSLLSISSISNLFSQNNDSIEIPPSAILEAPLPADIEWTQACTKQDLIYLDSMNIKVIAGDKNRYYWNSFIDKSIECKDQIQIYKVVQLGQLKAYCLACIANGKVTHVDACIQVLKK
ncbi:MAG: hypothetical protein IPM92_15895 [Saprospiraceae bacterium]|nr:hypothetical protein [Saprospiraceae bacterium]